MTRRALTLTIAGQLALTLSALCLATPARAQIPASSITLGDCTGAPLTTPASITLACGDGGFTADGLTWTEWGSPTATATGTATTLTCDPDCADGGDRQDPVTLTADTLETCRDGSQRYTRVGYAFPTTSPFSADSPGARDPYVTFPCPLPRPKLTSMRLTLRGHGTYPSYSVRVTARTTICAPKQRLTIEVAEKLKSGDGQVLANFDRSFVVHHPGGCKPRSFAWKLRDQFFGIGTYVVTADVFDSIGQTSRSLTRTHTTND